MKSLEKTIYLQKGKIVDNLEDGIAVKLELLIEEEVSVEEGHGFHHIFTYDFNIINMWIIQIKEHSYKEVVTINYKKHKKFYKLIDKYLSQIL